MNNGVIIYLFIGALVAAMPLFDKRSAPKYDEISTGNLLIGSLIVTLIWPYMIFIAARSVARGKK